MVGDREEKPESILEEKNWQVMEDNMKVIYENFKILYKMAAMFFSVVMVGALHMYEEVRKLFKPKYVLVNGKKVKIR